jgi:hypothetical protein
MPLAEILGSQDVRLRQIDQHEVGVAAGRDGALAPDSKPSRRRRGDERRNTVERHRALMDATIE